MVFFNLSIARVSLLFRLNVQESFSLLLKLSKFTYLPSLCLKVLLSSLSHDSNSFCFLLLFSHWLHVFLILLHIPFFKLLSIKFTSSNSFLISKLILFKFTFQLFLLLFYKFNLHRKFKFFILSYFILLGFIFPH